MSGADRANLRPERRYAYLHGFASGPKAHKGLALAREFAKVDLTLHRPDLNQPSFAKLTVTAMLEALDAMHDEVSARSERPVQWYLIASSLGGWTASLWAQRHAMAQPTSGAPGRIGGLILLCPGFEMTTRWPTIMGAEAFATWKREGVLPFPDGAGIPTPLHWGLVEDAARYDPIPAPPTNVPVHIVHGRQDEVVGIDSSRRYVETYASTHPDLHLHEVDDDHGLAKSVGEIWTLAKREWIDRAEPVADPDALATFHWDFFGSQARPTAEHFLRHLDEFLARESVPSPLTHTGVASQGAGHAEAFCRLPTRYEALIVASLKPRRKTAD